MYMYSVTSKVVQYLNSAVEYGLFNVSNSPVHTVLCLCDTLFLTDDTDQKMAHIRDRFGQTHSLNMYGTLWVE